MTLQNRLRELGYMGSAAEFRDLLLDIKHTFFPSFTDEELSYTVHEANEYCDMVRTATGLDLPREFILRTLNNIRKHPIKV
jgi:hypothetical protein